MDVLLIYKGFTSNGTSHGGLGWGFAILAKVYVREKWIFLTM
jgi:hypothetical protein